MPLSNMAVRDIETVIHPYTNLARHREVGPLILNEGRGIYLYDDTGKRYIEGMAGLWCTALGYGNQEIAEAGAEALRRVSFTHAFGGKSHDGVIELSEKLKEIAKQYNIPIMRNVGLANALYRVDVGQEVPEELYDAVAEVLNFVYQLKNRPEVPARG